VPLNGPEPYDVLAGAPDPAPAKVRRKRPALRLTAAALVLGVLAGGGAGYWVQQQRDPTPLPPLAATPLAQPKGPGPVPETLPADEDGGATLRGDLLKLLVPTPKGAHENDRLWLSLAEFASLFNQPAQTFTSLTSNDFQRAVEASWQDGKTTYTVHLVQFRDEASTYAPTFFDNSSYWGDETPDLVPGYPKSNVYGSGGTTRYDGDYTGFGDALYGNLYVEVYVYSPKPVASSTVMTVLKRQLERL
jgi:hypothetical protein